MEIDATLREFGRRNGLEIEFDENRSCTLELSDGRVMLLQERADRAELDFVATLGTVPENARAEVFAALLSANFYWNETFGATLSWNADLEEAVLIYPLPLAEATPEALPTVFGRFVDLQAAWAERLGALIAGAGEREDDDKDDDEVAPSSPSPAGEADADPHLIINP